MVKIIVMMMMLNAKKVDDVHMAPYLLHYLHLLMKCDVMTMLEMRMMMMVEMIVIMMMMAMLHLNKVNHLAVSVAFFEHLNCHSDRLPD